MSRNGIKYQPSGFHEKTVQSEAAETERQRIMDLINSEPEHVVAIHDTSNGEVERYLPVIDKARLLEKITTL